MIMGKIFYGACRYVCMDEKRAVVLEAEGVRDYNYKFMAADFEMRQAMIPSLNKVVFHGILSISTGEKSWSKNGENSNYLEVRTNLRLEYEKCNTIYYLNTYSMLGYW